MEDVERMPGSSLESFTRPEEINALSKYLSAVRKETDSRLTLGGKAEHLARLNTVKNLDGKLEVLTPGNDGIVSELVRGDEWKLKNTNHDIELPRDVETIKQLQERLSLSENKEKIVSREEIKGLDRNVEEIKVSPLDGLMKGGILNVPGDKRKEELTSRVDKLKNTPDLELLNNIEKRAGEEKTVDLSKETEKLNYTDEIILSTERENLQNDKKINLESEIEKLGAQDNSSLSNNTEKLNIGDGSLKLSQEVSGLNDNREFDIRDSVEKLSDTNEITLPTDRETLRTSEITELTRNVEGLQEKSIQELNRTNDKVPGENKSIELSNLVDNLTNEEKELELRNRVDLISGQQEIKLPANEIEKLNTENLKTLDRQVDSLEGTDRGPLYKAQKDDEISLSKISKVETLDTRDEVGNLSETIEKLDAKEHTNLSEEVLKISDKTESILSDNVENLNILDETKHLSKTVERLGTVEKSSLGKNSIDQIPSQLSEKEESIVVGNRVLEGTVVNLSNSGSTIDLIREIEKLEDHNEITLSDTKPEKIKSKEVNLENNKVEKIEDNKVFELSNKIDTIDTEDLKIHLGDNVEGVGGDEKAVELSDKISSVHNPKEPVLSNVVEEIKDSSDVELSNLVDKLNDSNNVELSNEVLDLTDTRETVLSDIIDKLNDPNSVELSNINLNITDNSDSTLSEVIENIEDPNEATLSDFIDSIQDEDDIELSSERLDLQDIKESILSNLVDKLNDSNNVELSNEILNLQDTKDYTLSGTRLDLGDNREVQLSNINLNITDTKESILSNEVLNLEDQREIELSDINLNIQDHSEQVLPNKVLNIGDQSEVELSEERLDLTDIKESTLSNLVDRLNDSNDVELSDEVLDLTDTRETVLSDIIDKLNDPNSVELSNINLNITDNSDSTLSEVIENIEDPNEATLSDFIDSIQDEDDIELSSERLDLQDTKEFILSNLVDRLNDSNNVELSNEILNLQDTKDYTLSGTRLDLGDVKDTTLHEELVSLEGKIEDVELSDVNLNIQDSSKQTLSDSLLKPSIDKTGWTDEDGLYEERYGVVENNDHQVEETLSDVIEKAEILMSDEELSDRLIELEKKPDSIDDLTVYKVLSKVNKDDNECIEKVKKALERKDIETCYKYLLELAESPYLDSGWASKMKGLISTYLNGGSLSKAKIDEFQAQIWNELQTIYIPIKPETEETSKTPEATVQDKISKNERVPFYSLAKTLNINPSSYLRWVSENSLGFVHGSFREQAVDMALFALVTARDFAEKKLGTKPWKLPGEGSGGLLGMATQGGGDLKGTLTNAVGSVASAALGALLGNTTIPVLNTPLEETTGFHKVSLRLGESELPPNPDKKGESGKLMKKVGKAALSAITGSNAGDREYGFTENYLKGSGIYTTLSELAGKNQKDIGSVEDLMKALRNGPYITTASKVTGYGKVYDGAISPTIDSNSIWEIILMPYAGVENGGVSFLPAIEEINILNLSRHGVHTKYGTWIPFTGFDLSKSRLSTKSLQLFSGEINYVDNIEFTNELRLTIADDQYKSWRLYFERCMDTSVYLSMPHEKADYGLGACKKITAVDKKYVAIAPYKNITFRCIIYSLTPQFSTVSKYDLLVVLKDFSEERTGEIESSAGDLNLTFSIVGENPKEDKLLESITHNQVRKNEENEKEKNKMATNTGGSIASKILG